MTQNGFAIFFMLTLIGCAIALLLSVAESWQRIVSVIKDETAPQAAALTYRTTQRRPEDVPAVAQRLLPRNHAAEAAAVREPSLWMFKRSPARVDQLRFEFA